MSKGSAFGRTAAIATMSLTGPLSGRLKAIAEAGFNGVELYLEDLYASDMPSREILRLASDLGLSIACLQPLRDFEGTPPSRRSEVRDMARLALDWCDELGVRSLSVCSNTRPHSLGDWDCIAEDLGWLAEKAGGYGVSLGYEPLSWGAHISDYLSASTLIDIVNHDNLGLTLDSFHWFARNQPLSLLAAIPPEKIVHVQLADGDRNAPLDFLQASRFHRLPLGEGHHPVFEFLRVLKGTGYGGPISVEIFNPERFNLPNKALGLWYRETLAMALHMTAEPDRLMPLQAERAQIKALRGETLHGH